jgi:predicted dehydrogenase
VRNSDSAKHEIVSSSRREFISGTTRAAFAAGLATRAAIAEDASRATGANETINIGLIGCGGRGRSVMKNYFMTSPSVQVVAVCDVSEPRMAQAQMLVGGKRIRTYSDYRKLLDDNDIDAVIVATNDHWHVLPTIHACQAGKDVYLEKPVGTSIAEGRAAVEAASKYNRVVQVGLQQRSWEHYRQAAQIIQSGALGEISEIKIWDNDYLYPGFGSPPDSEPPQGLNWDFWLGPAPKQPYNSNKIDRHYWFFDFGGGWQVNWGVHHYDVMHWFMGVTAPVSVTAAGGFYCYRQPCNTQWPDTFSAICEYGPGPIAKRGFLMQYTFSGGSRRQPEPACHGMCFYGTKGSLLVHRGGFELRSEAVDGRKLGELIESAKSENRLGPNHATPFLEAIRTRKKPFADIEAGHLSSIPGHLMNIAWKLGRKLQWNAAEEQIVDDPSANALLLREYRAPWKLEV